MKTITNKETIVGEVQSVRNDDYLIEFVIKTIREGESANVNISASPWRSWQFTYLKEGDEVQVTGQLNIEIWEDPFENEEWETLTLEATDISVLAA